MHKIDHHSSRSGKLVGIDKFQLHLLLKEQKHIFQGKNHDKPGHHKNHEASGVLMVNAKEIADDLKGTAVLNRILRHHHLQHRIDHGNAQRLQHGPDQHEKDKQGHLSFLSLVQQDDQFPVYLLHL